MLITNYFLQVLIPLLRSRDWNGLADLRAEIMYLPTAKSLFKQFFILRIIGTLGFLRH